MAAHLDRMDADLAALRQRREVLAAFREATWSRGTGSPPGGG